MDAPQYQQPGMDPSYALLMQQSKEQDIDAIKNRITGDTRSLTARYGELTSGDTGALLARYGLQLAVANSGGALPGAGFAKINGGM